MQGREPFCVLVCGDGHGRTFPQMRLPSSQRCGKRELWRNAEPTAPARTPLEVVKGRKEGRPSCTPSSVLARQALILAPVDLELLQIKGKPNDLIRLEASRFQRTAKSVPQIDLQHLRRAHSATHGPVRK